MLLLFLSPLNRKVPYGMISQEGRTTYDDDDVMLLEEKPEESGLGKLKL